jgi:hypothetical protein
MLSRDIISVYCKTHRKHTNIHCRQNEEFLIVKSGGKMSNHVFQCFFNLVCEAIGTTATPGLLCQPRVIVKMIVEKQMECSLAGETEVLGENLPQRDFCPSQNPT